MKKLFLFLTAALFAAGCSTDESWAEHFSTTSEGLFIVNEGNYQYGNSSLSYYDPETCTIENEVFQRANGFKLGDVVQSITVRGNRAWLVVSNSHVIFAIDTDTFREVGRITGFTSPRYMHFLTSEKAYVTQLWDNRIFVVNPKTLEITGQIECPGMDASIGSTEQMVQIGSYLYVSCWSYQNCVLKIDTRTDKVVGRLDVGVQPSGMVVDCNDKIWILTSGGYEGSPHGYEAPRLCRVDPEKFTVEATHRFTLRQYPSELKIDGAREKIYWINGDVWCMSVEADVLPAQSYLAANGMQYYSLAIDRRNDDLYVADAIDYQQQGVVYRYNAAREPVDQFYVGVNPGDLCWK